MKMLFAVLVIVSLLVVQSALALTVYLRPPKMIISLNTSDTVERSLEIKNLNNVTIKIDAEITGNLTEVLQIEDSSFNLEPNETRTLGFKTKADAPGVYRGEVQVTYSANVGLPVTVPAEITVIATKKLTQNYDTTILIVIPIILVAGLIYKKKRR